MGRGWQVLSAGAREPADLGPPEVMQQLMPPAPSLVHVEEHKALFVLGGCVALRTVLRSGASQAARALWG